MQANNLKMLEEGASAYQVPLSQRMLNDFSRYQELLVEWNDKVNLTAITDEEGIVIKHFIDSLSLSPLLGSCGKKIIDVGTGAGFPGIPIAIIHDDVSVCLLDSLDKRVRFLDDVAGQLGLKNIKSFHGRAEDFGVMPEFREQFDWAVARAVADLAVLCEYCMPFVKIGGYFFAMKGPEIESELEEAGKAIQIMGGTVEKVEKFSLPFGELKRSIVMIKKVRHTPSNYPRKSGKPTKSPIR